MTDTRIVVVKPNALSAADKKRLSACGIVVIEMENPDEFRFLRAGEEITGSEMLNAAMKAIDRTATYDTKAAFVKMIASVISDRVEKTA